MKAIVVSFGVGLVFAVGLAFGGMTQASKVVGFLDFFGNWDPSLMFVMGGAIAIYLPLFRLVRKRPLSALGFEMGIPTRRDLDPRLIGGAALFGIGWGLGGFCPGPGIVALASGVGMAAVFVASMLAGMVLFRIVDHLRTSASAVVGGAR